MIFILGFAAYGQTVFFPFVHDDIVFIQQNPKINDLDLKSIFTSTTVPEGTSLIVNRYYRPVVELFHRSTYQVFGLNPAGYHFLNILIHTLNSLAVFALLGLLIEGRPGVRLLVALLFLLHPVQTQAVACVSGVSNLLMTFFALLSVVLYVQAIQGALLKRSVCYFFSLLFFLTALMAKEQAVIVPALIILIELCVGPRFKHTMSGRIVRSAGFWIVLFLYLQFRTNIISAALPALSADPHELNLRLWSIPGALLTYLALVVFPYPLHYYRTYDILSPHIIPAVTLSVVILLIARLLKLLSPDDRRMGMLAIGWFLIALIPTLNIFPIYVEYSRVFMMEHFLYFPLVGLLMFLTLVLAKLLPAGKIQTWASVLTLGVCLLLTVQQNTYWRGMVPLFERAVKFEPGLGRLHSLLAKAYYFDGRLPQAEREFRQALTIIDGYFQKTALYKEDNDFYRELKKGIHFDLAHVYEAQGQIDTAISQYVEAVNLGGNDPALFNNLGLAYLRAGDFPHAIQNLETSVMLDNSDLMVQNNLAVALIQARQPQKAKKLLRQILIIDPRNVTAQGNLEQLMRSMKKQ